MLEDEDEDRGFETEGEVWSDADGRAPPITDAAEPM